jgi:hypothetical protein
MIKKHTEQRFEDAIVAELIKDGGCAFVNYNHKSGKSYVAGEEKGDFDRALALDVARMKFETFL